MGKHVPLSWLCTKSRDNPSKDRKRELIMYVKEYTIYVNEKDKVVKIMSQYIKERVACQSAMVSLDDKVELIRVRD